MYLHIWSLILSTIYTNAKKVLIVLTDGRCGDNVTQPAQQLENDGVILYSIGVDSQISTFQLNTIASLPEKKHVFFLNNFDELFSLAKNMSSTTCGGGYCESFYPR